MEFSGALETPVNPEVAPAVARWIKDWEQHIILSFRESHLKSWYMEKFSLKSQIWLTWCAVSSNGIWNSFSVSFLTHPSSNTNLNKKLLNPKAERANHSPVAIPTSVFVLTSAGVVASEKKQEKVVWDAELRGNV